MSWHLENSADSGMSMRKWPIPRCLWRWWSRSSTGDSPTKAIQPYGIMWDTVSYRAAEQDVTSDRTKKGGYIQSCHGGCISAAAKGGRGERTAAHLRANVEQGGDGNQRSAIPRGSRGKLIMYSVHLCSTFTNTNVRSMLERSPILWIKWNYCIAYIALFVNIHLTPFWLLHMCSN